MVLALVVGLLDDLALGVADEGAVLLPSVRSLTSPGCR